MVSEWNVLNDTFVVIFGKKNEVMYLFMKKNKKDISRIFGFFLVIQSILKK